MHLLTQPVHPQFKVSLLNPESWALEFVPNPSSTDKEFTIRYLQSRIHSVKCKTVLDYLKPQYQHKNSLH